MLISFCKARSKYNISLKTLESIISSHGLAAKDGFVFRQTKDDIGRTRSIKTRARLIDEDALIGALQARRAG